MQGLLMILLVIMVGVALAFFVGPAVFAALAISKFLIFWQIAVGIITAIYVLRYLGIG